jgi:hypothetical protein
MAKKKRVSKTTKNTKPNVYKIKGNYQSMINEVNETAQTMSDEDAALVEAKVLSQSNEKVFEHIIEMLQSGVLAPIIDECRVKLSTEYPIFKKEIKEREMFVVTMFLQHSLITKDTEVINDWGKIFKENPMNIIVKALKFVELVRNDTDMSNKVKGLDKVVDWNA